MTLISNLGFYLLLFLLLGLINTLVKIICLVLLIILLRWYWLVWHELALRRNKITKLIHHELLLIWLCTILRWTKTIHNHELKLCHRWMHSYSLRIEHRLRLVWYVLWLWIAITVLFVLFIDFQFGWHWWECCSFR